ncbi:hypothetical protein RclHR1_04350016 [Rhizophagus clarus]|uniref:Uncharacterized protein n=1 Tax=Rhizophagus clarus TaxID=94130 RepID=A0A2Z6RY28_9GLOM|nr:hypothetical protein RclHR1_04350016 [Rhizophagus clarus]GES87120.1 hypothetical protein GLOIN_2v654938 [Rhizophagus clarus]
MQVYLFDYLIHQNNLMKLTLYRVELIDDVNLFNDSMSEGAYIVNVLAPILACFFNKKKKDYGDTQDMRTRCNSSKKDDKRRSSEKKIKTIIFMREEDRKFSVTEVSGLH